MKIALLVGVAKYEDNQVNDLNACNNDVKIISKVLEKTGKYQQIISIWSEGFVYSNETKHKIRSIINELKGKDIDEVFFYFSGHGYYLENEFYHIFSDFKPNELAQTTLKNSELDSLLKMLNPKLTVKVIDACNSGIQYLKSISETKEIESYIKSSSGQYNDCIFLFSSRYNQESSASFFISNFTNEIINAVIKLKDSEIYFLDVIDYLKDAFRSNKNQTPIFIIQGDLTDIFFPKIEEKEIEEIKGFLIDKNEQDELDKSEETQETNIIIPTILELVKKDADRFINKEECILLYNNIIDEIKKIELNNTLKELFDKEIELIEENYNSKYLFKEYLIGTWLEKNKGFFAEPEYREKEVEKEVIDEESIQYKMLNPSGYFSTVQNLYERQNNLPKKIVKQKVSYINGYILKEDLPYKYIDIKLKGKFDNLKHYILVLSLIPSKTELKIFYFFSTYTETGWNKRELNKDFEWKIRTEPIKNTVGILAQIKDIFEIIQGDIVKELENIFINNK